MTVKIIKLGVSNIGSLANMLEFLDVKFEICSKPKDLINSSRILLPGVGSFDAAMKEITTSGIGDAIKELLDKKPIPILGICLGMQLLLNSSQEGKLNGLGLIGGVCKKFYATSNLKVPHMSWNTVIDEGRSNLLKGIQNPRFYFVHSYYAVPEIEDHIFLSSTYGNKFASGIKKNNILGVQFHPEKSHRYGLLFIRNFLEGLA